MNDRALIPEVVRRLPPFGKPSTSSVVDRLYWIRAAGPPRGRIKPFNLLYIDSIRQGKSLDMENILQAFEVDAEKWIAEHAKRRLFIHAGVVGWKGRAIILPGKTMSGKSTLVRKFVEAGATYLSDEYAVLDPHGFVHPYLRALSVRNDPRLRQMRIALKDLGSPISARPLPVGLIAISKYEPQGMWRPRELTRGRAVLALLANTICARTQPEFALSVLPRIAAKAPVLKGVRGEADQMIEQVLHGPYWS